MYGACQEQTLQVIFVKKSFLTFDSILNVEMVMFCMPGVKVEFLPNFGDFLNLC